MLPSSLRFDTSVIAKAPIEPDRQDFSADESDFYLRLTGELAAENEALKLELERVKQKRSYDEVRAGLMEPYANKVFGFLIGYCVYVAGVLILQGFKVLGFSLSDPVMAVISGSTAVSAIGLVGFVVSGLFRGKADSSG